MRRRDLLRDLAVLVPLAGACAPVRPSTPAPTAPPTSPAFRTPTYIAFQGPAPDIPGDASGLPPAYNTFPKNLVTSVAQPPRKGGAVNILTFTNAPAPPGVEQNGA
jgi:putative aldouronate transport system substrate-binding protein